MVSINNVVNDLRLSLRNRYVGDGFKLDEELLLSDMDKLQKNNYEEYANLISILFPIFYIFNENGACEYEDSVLEEAIQELEDDYDYLKSMIFLKLMMKFIMMKMILQLKINIMNLMI